jgi:hypothetical protein
MSTQLEHVPHAVHIDCAIMVKAILPGGGLSFSTLIHVSPSVLITLSLSHFKARPRACWRLRPAYVRHRPTRAAREKTIGQHIADHCPQRRRPALHRHNRGLRPIECANEFAHLTVTNDPTEMYWRARLRCLTTSAVMGTLSITRTDRERVFFIRRSPCQMLLGQGNS